MPVVAYGPTIAKIAGGFTANQATGGWIDDSGNLIVEPVTVFDITLELPHPKSQPLNRVLELENLAKRICKELSQSCVYLEVNGKVGYVK
jgi:hypothetical protein